MASSSHQADQSPGTLLVSVCVPATRWDTVGATVRAVRGQIWTDWELIVLGQGEQAPLEAEVAKASEGDRRVRYVQLKRRGLSQARNAALAIADGSVVAFTDDDCEPRPDWLGSIAGAFLSDPALGLVGGAVLSPESRGRMTTCPTVSPTEALYDPSANGRRPPSGWDWIGANFAIRSEVAAQLGKFDECLGAGADFPAAEDTDYKLRLESAGIKMLSTPRAAVVHTYGVRRGWAVLRSQQNYAFGNGGMAGKLTLLGDPRGEQWLHETRNAWSTEGRTALHRLPRSLRRRHYFSAAYQRCLREYRVDGGLLIRK